MPERIILIGSGGFGREALDVIEAINESSEVVRWNVGGVIDDAPSDRNLERLHDRGYGHLGSVAHAVATLPASKYVIGVGSPTVRSRLASSLNRAGWEPAVLVHPSARLGSRVVLGNGTVICSGVQLSTNSRLGEHVHLNPSSVVGHDAHLDDFVSVNPGAIISGEVRVGTRTLIGAGAVVLQGLVVGADALVGAAACVTRSVAAYEVVVGVPARPLSRSKAER